MRFVRVWLRVPICVLLAVLALPAAALSPDTPRAELQRWFAATQQSRVADLGVSQRWVYEFVATDTRSLEALATNLVARGYEIASLAGGPTSTLRVTREELHSPATLVQVNTLLKDLARRHGARYASFALADSF